MDEFDGKVALGELLLMKTAGEISEQDFINGVSYCIKEAGLISAAKGFAGKAKQVINTAGNTELGSMLKDDIKHGAAAIGKDIKSGNIRNPKQLVSAIKGQVSAHKGDAKAYGELALEQAAKMRKK